MRNKYTVLQKTALAIDLGFMLINGERVPGSQRTMITDAGPRGFRTKKEAEAFRAAITASHGAEAVGPVETI